MEDQNAKVVYLINTEDFQNVAKVSFGKQLSDKQIEVLSNKIGDYFDDWYSKIEAAIEYELNLEKLEEPNEEEYEG